MPVSGERVELLLDELGSAGYSYRTPLPAPAPHAYTEESRCEQIDLKPSTSGSRSRGLKATAQRDDIAQVFFESDRHISVEELCNEVRHINPGWAMPRCIAPSNFSKSVVLPQNVILPTDRRVLKKLKKSATTII